MDDIRTELMAVPGIAEADLDADNGDAPSGVRIRLSADADADSVGAAVQRILADHGMRSRFAGEADSAPQVEVGAPVVTGEDDPGDEPGEETEPPSSSDTPVLADSGSRSAGGRALESISVVETGRGVSITATTASGRTVTRESGADADDILIAAANAGAVLAESPPPEVLSAEAASPGGIEVVTVVLRRSDGGVVAGAAVAVASVAHAAARAAWDAIGH